MAIVKKYPARVVSIQSQIEGVYTVTLESMSSTFKYDPGQFLHLALDEYDPAGQWPESRCFSIQSSPSASTIKITFAVKGRFTERMEQELKVNSEIWIKLPYGDLFAKPHNKEHSVFISGGTGITPFLSLFTHDLFSDYNNPHIYLGFKSKEHNIYSEELNHTCNASKQLKVFYQDTDGLIDLQLVLEENGPNSYYFLSGPPSMIKNFKQKLLYNGVSANHVLTDDWE
jgi:ferredoxin-NADP reductase